MQRIGIIHLNQIGDLAFSLPLLGALRVHHPQAEIISIVKPNLVELLEGSPLVDRILTKKKGVRAKWELVRDVRKLHLDLLICLARSEESLLLTTASKAKTKAGFVNTPWDFALDVKKRIEGHNCWYNNAKLLRALGIPLAYENYVGLLHKKPNQPVPALPERYVVISAGASQRRLIKAWDEDKFAALILRLSEYYGLSPVLVGGADSQACNAQIRDTVSQKTRADHPEIFDFSCQLSLQQLLAVLQQASLFVGIDSGVMHLASALDIPVIGLFGPTDPFYVGPQNTHSVVVREALTCMPCYVKPTCKRYDCMRDLSIERVWNACAWLLDDTRR